MEERRGKLESSSAGSADELAQRVLKDCDRGYASDALARAFRDSRASTALRRRVARGVYAVLRTQRRLDFACDRAATRPLQEAERHAARWIARQLLDGELSIAKARALLPVVEWGALSGAYAEAERLSDPIERLAVCHSLSDDVASALVDAHGAQEAEAIARGLDDAPPLSLRANRLVTTREDLMRELESEAVQARPTALASDGVIVEGEIDLFRTAAFREGRFELQDEGSQLIGEIVAPPPGGRLVDFCAGAGGKTLHLAALLGGKGQLLALDLVQATDRLSELKRRARRAQVGNLAVTPMESSDELPPKLERWRGAAHRVLVDAPCSGLGTLRRNPEARLRIDRATLERLPEQQRVILARAAKLVAPGGRLIYSTCTMLPSENDEVIEGFLASEPAFTRVPLKEIVGRERAAAMGDGESLRLFPHLQGTDGFYASVLRRTR